MVGEIDTYQDHTSIELHHGKLLIQMNASLPRVADNASPGEKLWYYRELREMTREELGEKLGLKAGGVQNLEGRNNAIHYKNALRIGEILGIDPETLLDEYTRFCSSDFSGKIRRIREACGASVAELARFISVSSTAVCQWENEKKNRCPSRRSFEKIKEFAALRGVDINDA